MAETTAKTTTKKTTQRANTAKTKSATARRTKTVKTPKTKRTDAIRPMITMEERYRLIAESAYYKAHDRHFQGSDSLRDWLEAEAEIDSRYETARPH